MWEIVKITKSFKISRKRYALGGVLLSKLLKLIYSNKFFAIITLMVQIGLIAIYILNVRNNAHFFLMASNIISAVLILIEVNRHEETAFKITWIMLIAIVPVFGWFFYIYMHTDLVQKGIKAAHIYAEKKIAPFKPYDGDVIKEMDNFHYETSLAKYLSHAAGYSTYKNTSFKYFPIGETMFEKMCEELKKANSFIFIEFFIINTKSNMWKKLLSILEDKVKEGVDVRLMYDGMGCVGIMPKDYNQTLEKKGIKCQIFAPVQPLLSTYQNNRDHRKIVVIDGRCAFSGGINIADEYVNEIVRFGHWKDVGFMIQGEAVASFTQMFLTMWCTVNDAINIDFNHYMSLSKHFSEVSASGYVIPFADSPLDDMSIGRNAYMDILNTSKKYVHIMTPYFVIDEAIYEAMSYAVTRGVDVKLILPGIPDKKLPYCLARSYYTDLFKIGVEVYEYTPGFVHAKATVSDGIRSVVGTINYDYRSLYLHYECAAYIVRSDSIKDIEDDFINTLAKCKRITEYDYNMFPWYYRFAGRVLRFLAPLL